MKLINYCYHTSGYDISSLKPLVLLSRGFPVNITFEIKKKKRHGPLYLKIQKSLRSYSTKLNVILYCLITLVISSLSFCYLDNLELDERTAILTQYYSFRSVKIVFSSYCLVASLDADFDKCR